MALMLFGAAYNGGLATWGHLLQKNALDVDGFVNAW